MPYAHRLLLTLFLLMPLSLWAQEVQDNRRCRQISLPFRGQLDSLPLSPGSVVLQTWPAQARVEADLYQFEYSWESQQADLSLPKGFSADAFFQICYRVLPPALSQALQNRSEPSADTAQLVDRLVGEALEIPQRAPDFIQLEGIGGKPLQTSGQLSRGVSVGTGSAQDVGVNSALNLQLDGEIAPGLRLTASISDQQVPFQPEGNTQQLQDFDQILLQLRHERGLLQAGDLQLTEDSASYFLKFYKNVQGAQFKWHWQDTAHRKQETQVGIAAAKGVFQSQQLDPQEGVQGPYRLRGRNQERFILIMAGSERVFVDGKPLERGFDADYTIDYNQAEITFTNRMVITQFTRIRVDFEYAVQQYSRNILQATHREKVGELDWQVRFYREKDNPNAPLISEIGRAERNALEQAGDSLSQALVSTISETEYTPNQVLYEQKDTVVDGQTYRILVRSTNSEAEVFSAAFAEVGLGFGNYELLSSTDNGRVYQWVAPSSGIAQGSYAPIRRVPAPNQRQMLSSSLGYAFGNSRVYANAALSEQDQNLLSEKGDEDNQGWAGRLGYEWTKDSLGQKQDMRLKAFVEAEYDQQYFRPIDRFRSVEFDRDWSVSRADSNAADRIVKAGVEWQKGKKSRLSYRLIRRNREGATNGWQHWMTGTRTGKIFRWEGSAFLMESELPNARANSQWQRVNASVTKLGDWLEGGYRFSLDQNTVAHSRNDSIIQTAMYFQSHEAFVTTGDSLEWQATASYNYRTDQEPIRGEMRPNTRAHTANLSFKKAQKRDRFELLLTYRTLEDQQTEDEALQTLMARLDWDKSLWNRSIKYQLRFSTASGQELKREFVYLPVDVGTGTHNWRDDNGDGVQDLGEFYPAVFPDERRFARFFVPTDEYVQAFTTLVSARLSLKAPKKWHRSDKNILKFLSFWSAQGSMVVNKKTTSTALADRVWPGEGKGGGSLLSYKNQSRWSLFFNRGNPTFSGEYKGNYSDNKQLLTNGTQRSAIQRQALAARWSLSKTWVLKGEGAWAKSEQGSDALPSQNYLIRAWSVLPGIDYQPTPNVRAGIFADLKWKSGSGPSSGEAKANFTSLGLEFRSASEKRGVLSALVKASVIGFEGLADNPLGYDMLEALRPGNNWQWEASWNHRLGNGLQLTLRYQGRRPDGLETIHNGTAQVSAIF